MAFINHINPTTIIVIGADTGHIKATNKHIIVVSVGQGLNESSPKSFRNLYSMAQRVIRKPSM